MMLSKHTWKIISLLSLLRDQDGVLMETLEPYFDKRKELLDAADQLRRSGCITWDVVQNKLRLLEQPVKIMLGLAGHSPATGVVPLYSADERPLDAPLAAVLRSAGVPGAGRCSPEKLPERETRGNPAMVTGGAGREGPPARPMAGGAATGEKNISNHNVGTFPERERLTVSSNRLNVGNVNVEALRIKIRAFVGEEDFVARWQEKHWLWDDLNRVACLGKTFEYVEAWVRNGEIKIRKTRGACLWHYHQRDWEKFNAPRAHAAPALAT